MPYGLAHARKTAINDLLRKNYDNGPLPFLLLLLLLLLLSSGPSAPSPPFPNSARPGDLHTRANHHARGRQVHPHHGSSIHVLDLEIGIVRRCSELSVRPCPIVKHAEQCPRRVEGRIDGDKRPSRLVSAGEPAFAVSCHHVDGNQAPSSGLPPQASLANHVDYEAPNQASIYRILAPR
jgi:hypothetical protein